LAWRRDGVVRIRGIIETRWLELLREAAHEIRDEAAHRQENGVAPNENESSGFLTQLDLWVRNDKIARFMRESRLPEVAARVMESEEIRLYHDILIMKEQGCEEPTPWHQDSLSWEAVGRQLCGMWFSLDPVSEETGSLRLVRGSHEGPHYSHPKELSGAALPGSLLRAGTGRRRSLSPHDVALCAGERARRSTDLLLVPHDGG
jgi:ectoine hydroxylase-related dioxygenase (phytanoyl-CoA dioxygenase family)